MPAVHHEPRDTSADSLALFSADNTVTARQPAIEFTSDNAIALRLLAERSTLEPRQGYDGIIPTYYNFSGPAPGTVVGIVLGSVAGFLLIVWLLFSLTQINGGGGAAIAGEEEIVVRRRRGSTSGPNSGRSRRSTRTEMREHSRSPRRREQVIVEERRAPQPVRRSRSIIVEERHRVPGDDVVEVIEEHDDYRSRRGSRRSGGYR